MAANFDSVRSGYCDLLEVDVSVNVDELKFGILGSERTLPQPQDGTLVVGQTKVQI